jgi:UDP-2,3-diacylglucosamine pyrophosphatase LpxH
MNLTFEEVHIISDLHLGGTPGFQIFGLTAELKGLITYLAQKPAAGEIALIINGDFVDFLAEQPGQYFDPVGANEKLERISKDASFAPVFEALHQFCSTPARTLLINTGNHDVELALPWVRDRLCSIVSKDNPAALTRIKVVSDGTGISCQVGPARIRCVHGNEVDDWNLTDYEMIRRIARDINLGRPFTSWIPNAGSQLVIDVMNGIKRDYPFVDLLKPEVQAVTPILLALDPGVVARLPRIAPITRRLAWDSLRSATGFLEAEVNVVPAPRDGGLIPAPVVATRSDLPNVAAMANPGAYASAVLERTEERFRNNEDPMALADASAGEQFVGIPGAVWHLFRGDVVGALRESLEGLQKDRSFALDERDATFKGLDRWIGSDTDFLVAGHTHLQRALRRERGRGVYFNSGTWARLLRITPEVLADAARFREVYNLFKVGRIEALDECPELILKQPSVVSIWREGANVSGEIRLFHGNSPPFVPVPESNFKI